MMINFACALGALVIERNKLLRFPLASIAGVDYGAGAAQFSVASGREKKDGMTHQTTIDKSEKKEK
jgi:hypothetical protein